MVRSFVRGGAAWAGGGGCCVEGVQSVVWVGGRGAVDGRARSRGQMETGTGSFVAVAQGFYF